MSLFYVRRNLRIFNTLTAVIEQVCKPLYSLDYLQSTHLGSIFYAVNNVIDFSPFWHDIHGGLATPCNYMYKIMCISRRGCACGTHGGKVTPSTFLCVLRFPVGKKNARSTTNCGWFNFLKLLSTKVHTYFFFAE